MSEWTTTTIAEIAEIFDGPHATPKKTESGPWFLSISSLNRGQLDLSQSAHLSEEDFIKWTRRVTPRSGDLLFSYETRLGEAALMPDGLRACLGRRMGLLRPKKEKVSPHFLLYAYLGPDFQNTIQERCVHGATVDRIPLTEMGKWPISLPPREEQEAIASLLRALDDKIAVNDRIAATAETLAIAHASEQRWRSRIPLSAVVDSIRISVAPARMMEPKVAHYSLPAYDAEREPDIVSPGDIKSSKLLIDRPAVLTSKLNPSNPRMWRVEPDSEMPSLASNEFLILSPSTGLTVAEIWACCMQPSVIREASSKVTGTSNSHQRIKLAEFLALNIVSPREMRESTREAINSLCKKADCSRKENRSLKKIRDALLPKLMSGEIRIRDAERVVEDAV